MFINLVDKNFIIDFLNFQTLDSEVEILEHKKNKKTKPMNNFTGSDLKHYWPKNYSS